MSQANLTVVPVPSAEAVPALPPLQAERISHMRFSVLHAVPVHREFEAFCFETWSGFNCEFFGGTLQPPHIGVGPISSGRPGAFAETTRYGGLCDFTVNEGIAFGTNRDWVIASFPSEGVRAVVADVLLHLTVQQAVREIHESGEEGYRGRGPIFADLANRVGRSLGLGSVRPRLRGTPEPGEHAATHWPYCLRPAGYYGDDVTERLDAHLRGVRAARTPKVPGVGLDEYEFWLLETGQYDRLRSVILARIRSRDNARLRNRGEYRAIETGEKDHYGQPLPPEVRELDPSWMTWNNFCVPRIAEGIRDCRTFWVMPILADALEDVGCSNAWALAHCRAAIPHSEHCWVLRAIRDHSVALFEGREAF